MAIQYLTTYTLAHASGLAKRNVQVSIVTEPSDDVAITPGTVGRITIPFAAFFNDLATGAASKVGEFISGAISRTALAHRFRVYDITGNLDGSPHGSPVAEDSGSLPAAVGAPIPAECAAVLTLRDRQPSGDLYPVEAPDGGDPGVLVDRPRQRHAGRLYIGPLTVNTMSSDASGDPMLAVAFQGDVLAAAAELKSELAGNNMVWKIWSRVDQAVYTVDRVEMDNAFDTQRRRGAPPTLRTTVNI